MDALFLNNLDEAWIMKKRKSVTCYDGTSMLVTYYPDQILCDDSDTMLCLPHCIEQCEKVLDIFRRTESDRKAITYDEICDSAIYSTASREYDADDHAMKLGRLNTWTDPDNADLYPICCAIFRNLEIFVYLYGLTAVRDIDTGKTRFFNFY